MATNQNDNQITINTFINGMNTDLSPDVLQNDRYSYAQNIRIAQRALLESNLDPNSSIGIVSPVNRGFEFTPDGIFTGVNRILATGSIGNVGVVIVKGIEDDNGYGKWCVYKVQFTDDVTKPLQFKLIFEAEDAITNKKSFSIVLHKEQSDILKVYISDGDNPIMQINLLDEEYYNKMGDQRSINYLMSNHIYPLRKATIYKELSGQIPAGQIQYTYRFYKKNGVFTKLAPYTNRFQVFNNNKSQETGNAENTVTSKGYTVQINLQYYDNRIINKFDNVQIFRIQQIKENDVKYLMVADIKFPNTIPSDCCIYYNDYGIQTLKEYTKDEFEALSGLSLIPNVIESAQGYLFVANAKDQTKLKYTNLQDIHTKTYSTFGRGLVSWCDENDSFGGETLWRDVWNEQNKDKRSKYFRTRYTDINDDTVKNMQNNPSAIMQYFKYPNDENFIGGASPNVTWRFITTYVPLDNTFGNYSGRGIMSKTFKSVNDVYIDRNRIFLLTSNGGLYDTGITQEQYLQNCGIGINAYSDCSYSGIASSMFRSLRRDEVYRYGIIYYDQWGNSSDVQWMEDIVTPHEAFFPSTIIENGTLFARPLGLQITVNNLPSWVKTYQIVRCSKDAKYRRNLFQFAQTLPVRNNIPRPKNDAKSKMSPWYPHPFLTDNIIECGYATKWPISDGRSSGWKLDDEDWCTILMGPDINIKRESVLNELKGEACESRIAATHRLAYEQNPNDRLASSHAWGGAHHFLSSLNGKCGYLYTLAKDCGNRNDKLIESQLYQNILRLTNDWLADNTSGGYGDTKIYYQTLENNRLVVHDNYCTVNPYSFKYTSVSNCVILGNVYSYIIEDEKNHSIAYNSSEYSTLKSETIKIVDWMMKNVLWAPSITISDEPTPFYYTFIEYDSEIKDWVYKTVGDGSYLKGGVQKGWLLNLNNKVRSYTDTLDSSSAVASQSREDINQKKIDTSIMFPYYNNLSYWAEGSGVEIKEFADVKNPQWNDGFSNYQYNGDSRLTDASKKYKTFSTSFCSLNYVNWVANWKYDLKVGKYSNEWDNTTSERDWFREFMHSNDDDGGNWDRYWAGYINAASDKNPTNSGWIGPGPVAILAASKNVLHGCKRARLQQTVINIWHKASMFSGKTKEEMQYDLYYGFGNYGKVGETLQIFDGDVYITPAELTSMYKAYDFISGKDTLPSMQITNFVPIESVINTYLDYGMNYRNTGSHNVMLEPGEITGVATQSRPQFQYNYVFSCNNTSPFIYNAQSLDDTENTFPQRIYYSEKKTDGEKIDNWTTILANNFIDCDSRFGSVTSMMSLKDTLYYWQQSAFGKLSINERSLVVDKANNTIQLGQSGVLQRTDYIDQTYGMREGDHSSILIGNNVYWLDSDNVALLKYGQGIQNIGILCGVQNLLNSRFDKSEAPLIDYDEEYKELLCNCLHKDQLSFNLLSPFAQSVYTRRYDRAITINNTLYGIKKDGTVTQYNRIKNGGDTKYLTPTVIEFIVNTSPHSTKVFDNQQINIVKKEYNSQFEENFMKNKIFRYTTDLSDFEYKNNKSQFITNREGNIVYALPRIDGAFYGNRIRGKWLKVRMTDNDPKFDYSISNIITKHRQSFS